MLLVFALVLWFRSPLEVVLTVSVLRAALDVVDLADVIVDDDDDDDEDEAARAREGLLL